MFASRETPTQPMDVVFPVNVADMGLPPEVAPEDASYVLAVATVVDGVITYQIIDKMEYEDGKLHTRSLPFLGRVLSP